MVLTINSQKLEQLLGESPVVPSSQELRRAGEVFFIGASLPLFETLETMYESLCQEGCGLFLVTFGNRDELQRNLELVRSIKKNFSIRIMARVAYEVPVELDEQLYLAGIDILVSPVQNIQQSITPNTAFPRWSHCSILTIADAGLTEHTQRIDELCAAGIVPLLTLPADGGRRAVDTVAPLFTYLADAWQHNKVPVKPLLPLIQLLTPLEPVTNGGFLRSAIDRFHDRRYLVTSDLCRHLRTSGAAASFDSAGL